MGIFKKLFSMLGKKFSPDSKKDNTTTADAYIVIGSRAGGENFVVVNFTEGNEQKIAELMFLFYSGLLSTDCAQALMQTCKTQAEADLIFGAVTQLLNDYKTRQQSEQYIGPVVDPCEVFRQGDKNDFKG